MNIINLFFGIMIALGCTTIVIRNRVYRVPSKLISLLFLVFFVFPFSINLVDFLTKDELVSNIMRYAIHLLYILPIVMFNCLDSVQEETAAKRPVKPIQMNWLMLIRHSVCICSVIVLIAVLNWCSLSHDAYGYVIIANNQMMVKSTVLMSSIYQNEDYVEGTPVVLIGSGHTPFYEDNTSSITGRGDIKAIKRGTQGFYRAAETLYTPTHVERYLNLRLGSGFCFVNRDEFYQRNKEECDGMPIYPQKGSVTTIDGTIVVKLSEMK